jgi:hypothetical protein
MANSQYQFKKCQKELVKKKKKEEKSKKPCPELRWNVPGVCPRSYGMLLRVRGRLDFRPQNKSQQQI